MTAVKTKYHHGNLRETLKQSACDVIAKKTPRGFNLSHVAKASGVSAAAPYRHFESKEDLIVEIAIEGFDEMNADMQTAYGSRENSWFGLRDMGGAFLNFVRENRGKYLCMVDHGLPVLKHPTLAESTNQTFQLMIEISNDLMKELPATRRIPSQIVAQHLWACAQGVVAISLQGNLSHVADANPEDIFEDLIRLYLSGLGYQFPQE